MFRIKMLGVALAALTLAGCCHTSSCHRQSNCCPRPTAVQATPCPTPCPTGQVPPPPPAFIR